MQINLEKGGKNASGSLPRHFESASREAIDHLRSRIPMAVWLVCKAEGDELVVLSASDAEYGSAVGDAFPWSTTLCSQMVEGAPRFACDVKAVDAFADVLGSAPFEIGSYVGAPIILNSGRLFGTLCAIDPKPLDPSLESELPNVEFAASMLAKVLDSEMLAMEMHREASRQALEAEVDPLTSLFNRRGWEKILEHEENRCAHIGAAAAVVSIDLDDLKTVNDTLGHSAGDELLQRAASAIRFSIRLTDIAARLGGDEFAILLTDCPPAEARKAVRRIESSLDLMDVSASVGLGVRPPKSSLNESFDEADRQMRANKLARKKLDHAVVMMSMEEDDVPAFPRNRKESG